jgi:uncharacterized protein YdeI (YjbR/CyaY-like superfamily)
MDPRFFPSAPAFRRWLAKHHADTAVLWVGLIKKHSQLKGLRYEEAVEEALCFGWIDGQLRRIDDDRHMIRFTPRRPTSKWSDVNIRKYGALAAEGRIEAPGRAAFENRVTGRSRPYAYERKTAPEFEPGQEKQFRAAGQAWAFFHSQPPYYRRTATHWVISARRPETRERRLGRLIECSQRGERLPQLTPS